MHPGESLDSFAWRDVKAGKPRYTICNLAGRAGSGRGQGAIVQFTDKELELIAEKVMQKLEWY